MDAKLYINKLENSYRSHFKINKDIYFLENHLDMLAHCKLVNVRTMITEKDIIDSFETNEFCFVKHLDNISKKTLDKHIDMLIEAEKLCVTPHKDHKSSYLTGILISENSIDDNIKQYVKKFKFAKAYKFYWFGWCDIRLILIDLKNNEVTTNKAGKFVKKVYEKHFNKN
ncbi:hypothetical protein [Clostridium botulinum]|uniref:DUF8052 domain-containing protein n=1 Tax=Clostridium botulinum TaxID=1491 RepID=A0ABD7CML8_CLOBO|nr:hypothetical protein [Clostridium botulinum]KGO14251.1 hypothetical protein NZ45_08110 [Clostridium botulinum]KIN82037.1 hypothetical protein SD74_06665 [Clostridium botulinum]MCC5428694.1 hypothetical protein [Clostridium botulinum]QRI54171.1 hypothetical protein JQS73_03365 [Clostridium botulinum]